MSLSFLLASTIIMAVALPLYFLMVDPNRFMPKESSICKSCGKKSLKCIAPPLFHHPNGIKLPLYRCNSCGISYTRK